VIGIATVACRVVDLNRLEDINKENAMSRSLFASALAALVLSWASGLAIAQQTGTPVEAKAMFDRAVAALKADKATALNEFNDKNNKQFHDRDLYVFCYNMSDGKFTAHPNPTLMGTDVRTLKFKDDPFGQRGYDALKGSPEGSYYVGLRLPEAWNERVRSKAVLYNARP
jgi:hypothetical protein